MPRLHGTRERRDRVYFDTYPLEPGQTVSGAFDRDCDVGAVYRTNMVERGCIRLNQTFVILAIGLRLIGKTRDEEDRLLDHIMVNPFIGDRPYGPYPGSVCSTLRHVNEADEVHINDVMRLEKSPDDDGVMAFLPGYVLQRPLMLPIRQHFHVELGAAPELPDAVVARVMLFTLNSRDHA